MNRIGQIGIATLLTVLGSAVTGTAVGVLAAVQYVNAQIEPIQVQANQNTADIAQVNASIAAISTKLDFILGKYGVTYSNESRKIVIASSTY